MREILKKIKNFLIGIVFRAVKETKNYQNPIKLKMRLIQYFTINRKVPWPVHHNSIVTGYKNIKIGIDVNPGYSPGCYIQGKGQIEIGDHTQIAPNVGIITANHNLYDCREHIIKSVKIGSYCWIGMNSIITPGVELGDHTIVGAGSVVTKSFKGGYCVIAGNPAAIIKELNKNECIKYSTEHNYIGYKKIK